MAHVVIDRAAIRYALDVWDLMGCRAWKKLLPDSCSLHGHCPSQMWQHLQALINGRVATTFPVLLAADVAYDFIKLGSCLRAKVFVTFKKKLL